MKGISIDKIIVQYLFKLLQHTVDYRFAGNKLPFIKPAAVVEQQLDLGDHDIVAEVIDPFLQFFLHAPENGKDRLFFLLREVQGFIREIREKAVLLYLLSQWI